MEISDKEKNRNVGPSCIGVSTGVLSTSEENLSSHKTEEPSGKDQIK